jgi:hypothetical protein
MWTGAHVFSLSPGKAITVWYWWENFESQGVQVARPMPDVLGPNEVSGSEFGYLQCRLVASEDAVERLRQNQVQYSVTGVPSDVAPTQACTTPWLITGLACGAITQPTLESRHIGRVDEEPAARADERRDHYCKTTFDADQGQACRRRSPPRAAQRTRADRPAPSGTSFPVDGRVPARLRADHRATHRGETSGRHGIEAASKHALLL